MNRLKWSLTLAAFSAALVIPAAWTNAGAAAMTMEEPCSELEICCAELCTRPGDFECNEPSGVGPCYCEIQVGEPDGSCGTV
jgi:hypothetical protein